MVDDPAVKKQLDIIKSLFDEATEIIVATDAGREGELIFQLYLLLP
jgi:DNA topoisomerase-3